MTSKLSMYRLLGWKTHSKRSRWGHHIVNGRCVDCGKLFVREAQKGQIAGRAGELISPRPGA